MATKKKTHAKKPAPKKPAAKKAAAHAKAHKPAAKPVAAKPAPKPAAPAAKSAAKSAPAKGGGKAGLNTAELKRMLLERKVAPKAIAFSLDEVREIAKKNEKQVESTTKAGTNGKAHAGLNGSAGDLGHGIAFAATVGGVEKALSILNMLNEIKAKL